jgi:Na+/H+-translocating membrane pyrophosphatase
MYFFTFLKLKNKAFLSIIFGVFISILISIVIASIEGTYITESTREMVNEIRGNTSEAQSKFVSPVEPNTWYGESISIIYGFLAVNIPIIETFKHILKPQIIVFIIWQLFLFYILLKKLSKSLKNKEKYKLELWILLILFSYYIVQALFEPDLASAVRHKM